VATEIERRLDKVVAKELTEHELRRLADPEGLPEGYRNLLYVALADAARRKNRPDLASQIVAACTNPALQLAWERWATRTGRP
jgi:hypothetical protein